jgi:hypothetical protein
MVRVDRLCSLAVGKPMKEALAVFLAFVFCPGWGHAKDPSHFANFTGQWVLDFGQMKNPPAGLEDYALVVDQDGHELKVVTQMKGDLQPTPGAVSPGGAMIRVPGGGYGGRGGMGMSGRMGGGMSRGGATVPSGVGGGPRDLENTRGNLAAYQVYPQQVVYKLDGSESTAQFGDLGHTAATSNAEWTTNRDVLKLSLAGDDDTGQGGGKIRVKDQWQLSGDGKFLIVDRRIKSPDGSGTAHLVFSRKPPSVTNVPAGLQD